MPIELNLEESEINLVLSALGQQPYVNVADLIVKIATQARSQQVVQAETLEVDHSHE